MGNLYEALDNLNSLTLNESNEVILYALAKDDKPFHLGWKEGVFGSREEAEKALSKYEGDGYSVVEMPEDYFLSNSLDNKKYLKDKEQDGNSIDDVYYMIAEFLHIDPEEVEEAIEDMKNRLDELSLDPNKYLELLKQYQEEGKDINNVLDDYEYGDIK